MDFTLYLPFALLQDGVSQEPRQLQVVLLRPYSDFVGQAKLPVVSAKVAIEPNSSDVPGAEAFQELWTVERLEDP